MEEAHAGKLQTDKNTITQEDGNRAPASSYGAAKHRQFKRSLVTSTFLVPPFNAYTRHQPNNWELRMGMKLRRHTIEPDKT